MLGDLASIVNNQKVINLFNCLNGITLYFKKI